MSALYDPNSPYYRGTSINPSTGLPISGSVDASGCTYSAYRDDYHRRSSASDDYYRNHYNTMNNYNNPHSNYNNPSCSSMHRY